MEMGTPRTRRNKKRNPRMARNRQRLGKEMVTINNNDKYQNPYRLSLPESPSEPLYSPSVIISDPFSFKK